MKGTNDEETEKTKTVNNKNNFAKKSKTFSLKANPIWLKISIWDFFAYNRKTFLPEKKPANGLLDTAKEKPKPSYFSQKVISENYFGQTCTFS